MEDLPPELTARAAFLLRLALSRAEQMGEEALAELGITGRQYGALALLAQRAMPVQRALGAILGMDRTTTATVMRELDRAGLVTRHRDPANRRAYLVTLTPAGEQTRAAAAGVLRDCDDKFLEVLSSAQQRTLMGMLGKLAGVSRS